MARCLYTEDLGRVRCLVFNTILRRPDSTTNIDSMAFIITQ